MNPYAAPQVTDRPEPSVWPVAIAFDVAVLAVALHLILVFQYEAFTIWTQTSFHFLVWSQVLFVNWMFNRYVRRVVQWDKEREC